MLWELAFDFVELIKTGSTDEAVQLSLISSFIRLTQAYFQHLGNPATASAFSSSRLNLLLHNPAACQGHMLASLSKAIERRMELSAKAQQLLQEMLRDSAVQQAVMLDIAGGCKCLFGLVEQQGKRGAKSSRSSSSRSRINTSSSRKPGSSSSRKPGSSSSRAAGGAAAAAAGMAYPGSFAELPIVPDHDLIAAADGNAVVVAACAKVAGMRLKGRRPFGELLEYMRPSVLILIEAAADNVRFSTSAADLQLLLESVALTGFAWEKEGDAAERLVLWLGPLTMLTCQTKVAERRAFVSARGDLLLQVLGVHCRAVEEQRLQQQDMHGRREEGEKRLAIVLQALSACTEAHGLESEGERSADCFVGALGASVIICRFFQHFYQHADGKPRGFFLAWVTFC